MLLQISDNHWVDKDKIVRVYRDVTETKLSVNFIDKVITYILSKEEGDLLLLALEEERLKTSTVPVFEPSNQENNVTL